MSEKFPQRFDIYLVNFDPAIGREIQKSRPAVIISPNFLNKFETVIVAPLTSSVKPYMGWRVEAEFQQISGQIATDQLRTISTARLAKKLGKLSKQTAQELSYKLQEIFAY